MDSSPRHESIPKAKTSVGFEETHWTTVVEMASDPDSPSAGAALERLCCSYWLPVYAFLRKNGYSPADAEDLCQGFFVHLLRGDRLSRPSREQGRFRSWLLGCVKNFIHNERDRQNALTRRPPGGFVGLEKLELGESYVAQLKGSSDMEQSFDSMFADRLINSVRGALRAEYASKGKVAFYNELEPFLSGVLDGEATSRLAAQFDMTQGSIRVAHSRLKDRFGELLRQHVLQIVVDPADVDAEIRHLFKAWLSR